MAKGKIDTQTIGLDTGLAFARWLTGNSLGKSIWVVGGRAARSRQTAVAKLAAAAGSWFAVDPAQQGAFVASVFRNRAQRRVLCAANRYLLLKLAKRG